MNELLFRQVIFHPVTGEFLKWHYWGLIDGAFVGVDTGRVSPTKAVENSQRFTGLTDKKETRIYEGDIVLVEDTCIGRILSDGTGPIKLYNHIVPVLFEGSAFGVTIKHSADIFYSGFWSFIDIEHQTTQDTFEIIGNIYRNPELLKGKDED